MTRFSKIPARAWSDARITRSHDKLLGAIALLDQKGLGCFASLPAIGRFYGFDRSYTWRLVTDLKIWGYVAAFQNRNGYSAVTVRYTPEDHNWDEGLKRCVRAQRRNAKRRAPAQQGVVSVGGKSALKPLPLQADPGISDQYQTKREPPTKKPTESITAFIARCERLAVSDQRNLLRYHRSDLEQLTLGGFLTNPQRRSVQMCLTIIGSLSP